MEADFKCQFSTGFSTHKCPWLSAGRPAWPSSSRLMAWLSVGWELAIVDFVGCSAAEGSVRTVAVIPFNDEKNLLAKLVVSVWHKK